MNRALKFRGQRISDRAWIVGSLVITPNGHCYIYRYEDGCPCQYSVAAPTVEQLLVYNGKEYWEGDIDADGTILFFCKDCHSWNFGLWYPEESEMYCHGCNGDYTLLDQIDDFKPTGNIHNNPEQF